jgi:hypothetical protein
MVILCSSVDSLVGNHIWAANGFILVCQVPLLAGLIYMMNDIIALWLGCLCKFEI